ncbi:MAG: 4Fe-4S dicluster domain-containing protein [Desulfovibrio sp.]|jgi:MauM/NapG family ferredoxin protein|nr:4Fe-4S dicluster domain-containing protein [Desulfovibrio sp.]
MKHVKFLITQRAIQAASLTAFCLLLASASWPLPESWLPVDLFLRLDPLTATLIPLAARQWLPALVPGLAVLAVTVFAGRVFCGYICPMGITLDLGRFVASLFFGKGAGAAPALSPRRRALKYLILAGMAGAALFGVNLVFWGSPLALVTRLYALLLHPLLLIFGDGAMSAASPLFNDMGLTGLAYAEAETRRFGGLAFILVFFTALFTLERVRPRFWCRYLCPAGALMGLASLAPPWRRRVDACLHCGACARACPAGAVAADGEQNLHSECLTCRACADVCPTKGTRFSLFASGDAAGRTQTALKETGRKPVPDGKEAKAPLTGALPTRRAFLGAMASGTALAGAHYAGARGLLRAGAFGNLWDERLIRPPAALPEPAFLDRCIRCGECMKVCPSNGLQPSILATGLDGVFSPLLVPRIGPCEPGCNACGRVCPTGAILSLPIEEKRRAKVGTAVVLPERCLAWGEGKSCVVCQEVCPYGAVKLRQRADSGAPAPVVEANRCYGCGYCERHCPTRVPAINILPLNALRLSDGNYRAAAEAAGLDLTPGTSGQAFDVLPEGQLPPGFSE